LLIRTERASFPIDWMCRKLKISRASYYRWLRPAESTPTRLRHEELEEHVLRVFGKEKGRAGRDQVALILRNEGVRIAAGTVGAILRQQGLRAVRMRAWKKTTTADPDARTEHIKNHMLNEDGARDFSSEIPGTKFCGDITYLRTGSGWLYLATVIDLATRMIVGWSMASHMRTSLVVDALTMARDHGHLAVEGTIFHSDRGSQYTAGEFQSWCASNGVTQSMGAVGVCWDNAVAESFFSHMKTEMFYQQHFDNHLAARTAVMEYIESWYNRRRPHRNNRGLPPAVALSDYRARCDLAIAA